MLVVLGLCELVLGVWWECQGVPGECGTLW